MRLIISVQPTFIHFLEKQNTEGSDKSLKNYLESTVWLNQSIQQEQVSVKPTKIDLLRKEADTKRCSVNRAFFSAS